MRSRRPLRRARARAPSRRSALRALDVTVRRRIEGLLAGDHRAASLGVAMELAQVRPYEPGDDVRLIDWNATARMNEPHVRMHVAERALTTWLLFDASASMGFGTALRRKADVAEGVVLAVGHVASRRGNRLGLLTYGACRPARRAAAPGPPRPRRGPAADAGRRGARRVRRAG